MKVVLATVPVIALLACSSPGDPAKAEPAVNQQQLIDHYANDIWPATRAYNAAHSEGGTAATHLGVVIGPNLGAEQFNALRKAAQSLGRQGEYDSESQTTHYNEGLHLERVDVQSVQRGTAALNVCYSYDDFSYVNPDDVQRSRVTSEVTAQLAKVTDVWYLRGIADDHWVLGCGANGV